MTAPQSLVLSVRLHDNRYHGVGEPWPSPGRLFQALVAGAARGAVIDEASRRALQWLERQSPPTVFAPPFHNGQRVVNFVPDNDLDSVDGNPVRIGEIRSQKICQPRFFEATAPFVYCWTIDPSDDDRACAQTICRIADQIYQLGRGIDMAWAAGEIVESATVEARYATRFQNVHRPQVTGTGTRVPCPSAGSLASLEARFAASTQRFTTVVDGRATKLWFSQAPKSRFAPVAYDCAGTQRVFELRKRESTEDLAMWPTSRVARLVERIRDAAVDRLKQALPQQTARIEAVLVGRKPDGTNDCPPEHRVQIVPLPSIGHEFTHQAIRRVLVVVPADCPVPAGDLHWALSGLDLPPDSATADPGVILVSSSDNRMLQHYLTTDRTASCWRSVTPVALPESAARRRIDPARQQQEAKPGTERSTEIARAAGAVVQALRHSGITQRPATIRVQHEPFDGRGLMAEAFSAGTRFRKERLWHVELRFDSPISGPIVLGDGRFLGLGLMRPVHSTVGVLSFGIIDGLINSSDPLLITQSLRRAVMARVQGVIGVNRTLPPYITGHSRDGAPAQSEESPHLTFAFDPTSSRLLVIAPHIAERRELASMEGAHLRNLETALGDFRELRAGSAGLLSLEPLTVDCEVDSLFAASCVWESLTPYVVNRHKKGATAADAVIEDVRNELQRRKLPTAQVEVLSARGVPGVGLEARVRLTFATAQTGPVILGKSRHLGGGLFVGTPR